MLAVVEFWDNITRLFIGLILKSALLFILLILSYWEVCLWMFMAFDMAR